MLHIPGGSARRLAGPGYRYAACMRRSRNTETVFFCTRICYRLARD